MESHEGGENMRLCRGDCIGLAAPSHLATREGCAPVIQAMEARGYRVKTAENMFSSAWGFAASAEDRARDINQLIADDEVKLIFFGGGEGGDEVIPLIDYASAAAHPKMWLSFSDGTSILSAINRRAGLMVLYGQSPGGLVEPSAYDAANFRAHVEEGCGPMHLKSGAWRTVTGGTASDTLSGGYLDNYVFLAASGWIAPKPEEEFILALEEHEMFFGVEHVSDSIGRLEQTPVMPHVRGRERILQVHAKDKPIGSDVDLKRIAQLTPGFTGADLMNLMNESALLTARRGKKIITMREVNESMERVIAGPERKGRVMDEATKHTIAYHESGHALVGHLLPHADPVHKISIISRGRALGYTLSIPKEDKVLNTVGEMLDELAVFMGGRVAEEIFCDDVTTGASNDLERATKMARAMVTQYGMSAALGTQVFGQPNHEVFLGRDYGNTQDYSEETARRIDDEVARIMKGAHDRAYEILSSHRDQMDLMASVLLERETIDGAACQALLDNRWSEYLEHEDEIIAKKDREEAEARARDAKLADPNWNADAMGGSDVDGSDGAPTNVEAKHTDAFTPHGILNDLEAGFRDIAHGDHADNGKDDKDSKH